MDGIAHDELYPHAFKNKNWSGLLIEPMPVYFNKLKTNYENRENLIFKNVAITDKQETKDIYTIPRQYIEDKSVPSWCDGISTFNISKSPISYDGIKDKAVTEQVVCCPFKDLVDEHKITNIDILQIDCEGHDFIVFNQIWQLGFRPKVIYIEIVHLDNKDKTYLISLLQSNNYTLFFEGDNLCAVKSKQIVTTFSKTKRVALFVEASWALGSIHSALCKELYKYNIDADLLDWSIVRSSDEWKNLNKIYDIFVTLPGTGVLFLEKKVSIPSEKIIAIAHGESDLKKAIEHKNNIDALLNFACITLYLKDMAKNLKIVREPKVIRNGIHFDRFYQPVSQSLRTLGYAGALKFYFEDFKRSHLAQQIAQTLNMPLHIAEKRNFLFMPNYYSEIDALIVSSHNAEACGLPLMEAAAAGRLPISARVGITRDFQNPPGVILPLDDEPFVKTAIENIMELKDNPVKFTQLCKEAQAFARDNYDWKHVAHMWADVINNV